METQQTYKTFAQAAPDYQGKPVLIDIYEQNPIHIGTFVLFTNFNGQESIGRIVRAVKDTTKKIGEVEINIFEVINKDNNNLPFNMNQKMVDCHVKFIPELMQTLFFSIYPTTAITDLAFVVHTDICSCLSVNIQGMENSFRIKYRCDGSEFTRDHFQSFPCEALQRIQTERCFLERSFSKIIFDGLNIICQEIRKATSVSSKYLGKKFGRSSTKTVGCPPQFGII